MTTTFRFAIIALITLFTLFTLVACSGAIQDQTTREPLENLEDDPNPEVRYQPQPQPQPQPAPLPPPNASAITLPNGEAAHCGYVGKDQNGQDCYVGARNGDTDNNPRKHLDAAIRAARRDPNFVGASCTKMVELVVDNHPVTPRLEHNRNPVGSVVEGHGCKQMERGLVFNPQD